MICLQRASTLCSQGNGYCSDFLPVEAHVRSCATMSPNMANRSSNHASRQRTKPVAGCGWDTVTCMLLGSEYSTDPHAMTIEPVTAEVTGQLGPCQLGPRATHWGSRLGSGVSESPGSQAAGCQWRTVGVIRPGAVLQVARRGVSSRAPATQSSALAIAALTLPGNSKFLFAGVPA